MYLCTVGFVFFFLYDANQLIAHPLDVCENTVVEELESEVLSHRSILELVPYGPFGDRKGQSRYYLAVSNAELSFYRVNHTKPYIKQLLWVANPFKTAASPRVVSYYPSRDSGSFLIYDSYSGSVFSGTLLWSGGRAYSLRKDWQGQTEKNLSQIIYLGSIGPPAKDEPAFLLTNTKEGTAKIAVIRISNGTQEIRNLQVISTMTIPAQPQANIIFSAGDGYTLMYDSISGKTHRGKVKEDLSSIESLSQFPLDVGFDHIETGTGLMGNFGSDIYYVARGSGNKYVTIGKIIDSGSSTIGRYLPPRRPITSMAIVDLNPTPNPGPPTGIFYLEEVTPAATQAYRLLRPLSQPIKGVPSPVCLNGTGYPADPPPPPAPPPAPPTPPRVVCGGQGQPCCGGNNCNNQWLTCQNGTCVSCGERGGMQCCPWPGSSGRCSGSLQCRYGSCQSCGGEGQQCCFYGYGCDGILLGCNPFNICRPVWYP